MPTPARVVVVPEGPGRLRIEEVELPDPGPYQVVVKQFASGVCHSQLHQMHGPRPSQALLGHESTGVVVAAGSEVSHVKEGDRVMVTWVPRDPQERRIAEGVSLTLGDGSVATTPGCFTWADNTIADEQYVVPMPADTPVDVTSIIGCAVMTGAGAVYHTAAVQRGQSVAVFGVGGGGGGGARAAAPPANRAAIATPVQATRMLWVMGIPVDTLSQAGASRGLIITCHHRLDRRRHLDCGQ